MATIDDSTITRGQDDFNGQLPMEEKRQSRNDGNGINGAATEDQMNLTEMISSTATAQ